MELLAVSCLCNDIILCDVLNRIIKYQLTYPFHVPSAPFAKPIHQNLTTGWHPKQTITLMILALSLLVNGLEICVLARLLPSKLGEYMQLQK